MITGFLMPRKKSFYLYKLSTCKICSVYLIEATTKFSEGDITMLTNLQSNALFILIEQ